jgi:hypothetical protein
MSARAVIKSLLEASAGVAALAGSRIYAATRPEGDPLPALVLSVISDAPMPPIRSYPAGPDPCMARIQASCLAASAADAESLKAAAVAACHKQSGTIDGVTVMAVLEDVTGPDTYDALVDTYQQSVDFVVHYMR